MKTATTVSVACLGQHQLGAGGVAGEVGGPAEAVGPFEEREDLVLAVDVVAQGEDVDARLDQLLVGADGQARAARGVLGVADDQVELPAVDQPRQDLADDLAAGRADDVADEQDLQGHERGFQAVRARRDRNNSRAERADQRAYSTARVSRRTVTLTSPG